ncbi:MAG: sodium/solute symporter [Pirellulales bacterium]
MLDLTDLRLHWLDTLIIIGYLGMLLGIGVYHARRQKDLTDFFLAGREIRWLALGLSLVAALNSGIDYLMQPSAIIQFGAYMFAGPLTWLFLIPYIFYVTLPLYRRLGVISAYEYLEKRFDLRVRTFAAGIFLLWRLGWLATALYVPSLAISTATGGRISESAFIVLLGLVITAYTMLGGIRAVIWNDVIQCCIMFAGLFVAVIVCVVNVEGGVGTIVAQIREVGDPIQTQVPTGVAESAASYFFIPMTFIGLLMSLLMSRIATYTSDQVMVQRFQTSKTLADGRRGLFLTAISDSVWTIALCFVGLALFAFYKAHFGELPAWTKERPDQIFPYFISQAFPIGLTGLIMAAILAASVSSCDSAINSLTSVVTVDFVERLYLKRSVQGNGISPTEQRYQVLTSRLITIVVGLAGIGISLQVNKLGSLLEISNKLINSFTGPMLAMFLLGMFTSRATGTGVLIGGAIGTLVTVVTAFQAELYAGLNLLFDAGLNTDAVVSFLWPSTLGFLTTCVLGYLCSLLWPSEDQESPQAWTWSRIVQTELLE